MSEKILDPRERSWAKVHVICVFFLFLYFMVQPVNTYLWESIRGTYYYAVVPVLIAFCLYFRRLKDVVEIKLLILFALWYFISRFLNGMQTVINDFSGVLNFPLYFVFAVVGFLLTPEKRMKYLIWLGAFITFYFTVLGLISIYTAIYRLDLVNPITEGVLCSFSSQGFSRLNLFDANPNTSAMWFFVGFSPALVLFFACKKKLWRIPIVLAALVNYLGLALTYSRNTMIAFSCCIAMLAVLIVLNRFPLRKLWVRTLAIVLILAVFVPAVYKSFELSTDILSKVSASVLSKAAVEAEAETTAAAEAEPAAESAAAAETEPDTSALFEDSRDLSTLRLRLLVFKTAFITIQREPIRLIRGCAGSDVMSVSHQAISRKFPTMHNSYLEVMVLTGLPGLALVIAFSVLLVIRMIRVFFSTDPRLSLAVKVLTLPLAGIFLYSMMEAQIFFNTEFSALFFYLLAGVLLAYSYEVFPPKKNGKAEAAGTSSGL